MVEFKLLVGAGVILSLDGEDLLLSSFMVPVGRLQNVFFQAHSHGC